MLSINQPFMKIYTTLLITLAGALIAGCGQSKVEKEISGAAVTGLIRINQDGYFPSLEKNFTVAGSLAEDFQLVNDKGRVVFRGKLSDEGKWGPSGEYLKSGSFPEFSREGTYRIYVPGTGKSYPFSISGQVYRRAAVDAMETFFFMRASMDMDEKYLGKFSRRGGHPDDTCYYHESTGHMGGFRSSPGGWYDAGDYGKYIVNASISTGTLLALYEMLPQVYEDGTLDIPEAGNGTNDLLDELRYEFNWVLTMQDDDGGVFHKLTALWHDGVTMPDKTPAKRYIIGKSTAASLDFAAMLAQASRLYRELDPGFSQRCLDAAEKAYRWAVDHPDRYFSNPPGVGTGEYGDRILKEEFFWAAAELFCTTGETEYYDAIKPDLGNIRFRLTESWRNYVDNIGYYSLCMSDLLDEGDRKDVQDGIIRLAGELLQTARTNPYGIPVSHFEWGSNSDVLNTAIVEIFAHHITGDKKYLDAAAMFTDYIFGRNATGYCFVSGQGTLSSGNFHHRLLMADDNEETFPGYVAGGPNGDMQDRENLARAGVSYPDTLEAKAYIDHAASYASNEICINWNAPLVFVLAYLDQQEH